jgi:protein-S-isoprenylcysteine O-methyltransferase Ste14
MLSGPAPAAAPAMRLPGKAEGWLFARRGQVLAALFLILAGSRFLSERPLRPAALLLLALAMAWRLWAGRTIGAHSNGAAMGGGTLATGGAYAFGRHPLYLSNQAAVAGLLLFANSLPAWAALLLFLLAFLQHAVLARAEEARLEELHGEAWRRYRKVTPMWLGIPRPAALGGPGPGSLAEAWRRQGPNLAKAGAAALLLWGLSLPR